MQYRFCFFDLFWSPDVEPDIGIVGVGQYSFRFSRCEIGIYDGKHRAVSGEEGKKRRVEDLNSAERPRLGGSMGRSCPFFFTGLSIFPSAELAGFIEKEHAGTGALAYG